MFSIEASDFLVVGTLVLLEGLLSADNALVLALLVRHLPEKQQHKALLYGLVGAFVLRGIFIAAAAFIIRLWWLCSVGAVYLISLAVKHFITRGKGEEHDVPKKPMGFWQTVVVVEFTDIVFAIDSILVAVALVDTAKHPDKLWVVYAGGFMGIILLRMAAGFFIKLIKRYPALDNMAYALVGWAGFKLANASLHLAGKQYGFHAPNLMPTWLFWTVFSLIVVLGVFYARKAQPSEEDRLVSEEAGIAIKEWDEDREAGQERETVAPSPADR